MDPAERQSQFETDPEVMKLPEISVEKEKSAVLLSMLFKGYNPEWGSHESQIAKETEIYFAQNPLTPDISAFLDEIHALKNDGVDEEALCILALTYQHPERAEKAFEVLAKHKVYIRNPRELQKKLLGALAIFERSFAGSSLEKKINDEDDRDKKMRLVNLEMTKQRMEKLINFFRPDVKTTGITKISITPTDRLYKKDSGRAFIFGEELVLMSHIDNPDNLDHEFLHSVINPIVDKLSQQLNDKQKERISQLASNNLKQDYGENYYSVLCEELIRTHNDIFQKGKRPRTYEVFKQDISGINDDQFQKFLAQSESLKARCEELEITTIEDFKNKSQEYFEQFEKNQLRGLVFELYQEYSNRPDKENVNFENFILENFGRKI